MKVQAIRWQLALSLSNSYQVFTVCQVHTFYLSYNYFSQQPHLIDSEKAKVLVKLRLGQCYPANEEQRPNFSQCFLIPRPGNAIGVFTNTVAQSLWISCTSFICLFSPCGLFPICLIFWQFLYTWVITLPSKRKRKQNYLCSLLVGRVSD